MQNQPEKAEVFLTTEQWTTLSDIFGLKGEGEYVEAIQDLIAGGFPVYAKTDFGIEKFNLAEIAATHESMEVVLYLQQAYPELVNSSARILHYMLPKEGAVEQLVAGGYPLASIIATDPKIMREVCSDWNIGPGNLKMLAEHGLKLDAVANIQDVEIRPLIWLGQMLRGHQIDAFLVAGADPGVTGEDGRNFLHHSVTEGRTKRTDRDDGQISSTNFGQILDIALAFGANLDAQDNDGNSPLHLAAKMGYANKVRLLIERGASTGVRNNKGKTPQQLAQAAKRTEALQMFAVEVARQAVMRVAFPAKSSAP